MTLQGLRAWPLIVALVTAVATGACATASGARPRPFPSPAGTVERPAPPAPAPEDASVAEEGAAEPSPAAIPSATTLLLTTALDLRGVPYRNGGSDPTGFDCSGFTQWVFARNGIMLPREVKDQIKVGASIDRDAMAAGDLVFFATTNSSASHVGIALDAHTFVHAPSSRGVVRVERITIDYWNRRFVGVRRVTGN